MKEVFGLFLLQKIIHCPILHQSLGGRGGGDDEDEDRDVRRMLIANDVDEVLLQGCLVKVIMILKTVKMVTTMITTAMTMMMRRRKNPPQEEASDDDDKLHLQVVCILFHPNKQTLQNRDHSLRAATNLHDDDDDDVDDVDDDDDEDNDDDDDDDDVDDDDALVMEFCIPSLTVRKHCQRHNGPRN